VDAKFKALVVIGHAHFFPLFALSKGGQLTTNFEMFLFKLDSDFIDIM